MTSDRATRYRAFLDIVRASAGGGAELVYAPLSRTAHLLEPLAVRALVSCRGVATLDDHADRAASAGLPRDRVRVELEGLARSGLLVSEALITAHLAEHRETLPATRIASLAIPTRDRPELLREALRSYVGAAERNGRDVPVIVVDQSADDASRAVVESSAASLQEGAVVHVGPADVERFAERLAARSGVDPELVRFALLAPAEGPDGAGRSRNAILLHGAGQMLAMVDDDTRGAIAPAPDAAADLALTSLHEPSEHWFVDRDAPPSLVTTADVCTLHETLLGRLPGEAAREAGGADVSRASSMFFRRLTPRGGRVLVTQLGSRGDAGTGSMLHLLTLAGPSRDRLLASEDTYRAAFTSRLVTRAATRPTIGDGAFCMTMAIGLDARGLLPPFPPTGRNGDGVFGLVLRVAWHDAYLGFLPSTVEHAPSSRAAPFEERFATLGKLGAADILAQLVLASRVEADVADPAASLVALGDTLARWGSLSLVDFEEIVRLHVLRARARDLALHEELRAAYRNEPAFWAHDVERAIAILRESATRADAAWPADLCAALGESAGREALRRLVLRYGQLLRVWPRLWSASIDLRADGNALTRERSRTA